MKRPLASLDSDTSFTLDDTLLAQRKAANLRRLYTRQIPALRVAGFVILCAIALVHDWRADPAFPRPALLALMAVNLGYAALSWLLLRRFRSGGARPEPAAVPPGRAGVAAQPVAPGKQQPVLRLPAAGARGRPGGLRLSPCAVFRPRGHADLPRLRGAGGVDRPGARALGRPAGHRCDHVPAGAVPVADRAGHRAAAQAHAPCHPCRARAGRRARRRRRWSWSRRGARPSRRTWRSRSSWPSPATRSARR